MYTNVRVVNNRLRCTDEDIRLGSWDNRAPILCRSSHPTPSTQDMLHRSNTEGVHSAAAAIKAEEARLRRQQTLQVNRRGCDGRHKLASRAVFMGKICI